MTDRMDINRLLVEMRNIKAQTQAFQKPEAIAEGGVAGVNKPGETLTLLLLASLWSRR